MKHEEKFIQNSIFLLEENDSVELKEIKSKKIVNTIVNYTEEYVIGFLNAQIEGNLYLGIDDSGIIKGVELSRNDRDEIQRSIPNKLRETKPPSHMKVETHLYEVLNSAHELIENLFVVHIYVIKTKKNRLFRTSGGSVYLKKGSNCMKLKDEEIDNEIIRRKQINLQKKAEELDQLLEKEPNDLDILQERADIAFYMDDSVTMDKMYKKIIDLNPKDPKVRIKYAEDSKKLGNLKGGLSVLNDAIESGVNDNSILKNKGLILQNLGRLDEAYKSYEQAYNHNPNDYTTLTQIGIVLRQLGHYKESIQFLNDALKKCPNYRLAKYEKKKTYHEMFKKS